MKGNYRNVLSRTARNTFFTPGPNLSLPGPMLRSSSPWTQWRHSGMPVCQTWEVEKSDPAIDFASFCMTCAPAIPRVTGWNCLNCWLFVEFLWFSIIAEASAKSARRKAREGRVCRCALSPDEYGVVAQSLAGTAQGNRNRLEIADWMETEVYRQSLQGWPVLCQLCQMTAWETWHSAVLHEHVQRLHEHFTF